MPPQMMQITTAGKGGGFPAGTVLTFPVDDRSQFDQRPGDGTQEGAAKLQLAFVMLGQLGEDLAEMPGLFAHLDQLAEQQRKEIPGGGQGRGHALPGGWPR